MIGIFNIDELVNPQHFPFFYLKEYVCFEKETSNKDIIYFADNSDNSMPIKIWRNKILKLIQIIYPPLNPEGNRLNEKEEELFLKTFVLFIKEKKIAHRIIQPENFAIFNSVPNNSIYAPFGTYSLDLEKYSEDELFKNLHSKNRNVIRNAEKNNVIIKYGKEFIDDFYLLYKQTMKRSNMYCHDISYFKKFYNYLPQNVICGVVYYDNIPQGGLFAPYTKFGAFYLYGSSAKKISINGAINYLHWNTMKLLKQKGVKRYDFVGARLSNVSGTKFAGIQQFKERFGAVVEKGFLWKMDFNRTMCNLYDLLLYFKVNIRGNKILLDIISQEKNKLHAN